MTDFNDFFVASAGAAAALTGLIFVGISINHKEIIKHESLPTRASLALILLMAILISSIISLTHLPLQILGMVILALGTWLWLALTIKDVGIYHKTPRRYQRLFLVPLVLDQVAALPYLFAGAFLIAGVQAGIYFVVAAYVISFIKAVWDAWVLMIEILR